MADFAKFNLSFQLLSSYPLPADCVTSDVDYVTYNAIPAICTYVHHFRCFLVLRKPLLLAIVFRSAYCLLHLNLLFYVIGNHNVCNTKKLPSFDFL